MKDDIKINKIYFSKNRLKVDTLGQEQFVVSILFYVINSDNVYKRHRKNGPSLIDVDKISTTYIWFSKDNEFRKDGPSYFVKENNEIIYKEFTIKCIVCGEQEYWNC